MTTILDGEAALYSAEEVSLAVTRLSALLQIVEDINDDGNGFERNHLDSLVTSMKSFAGESQDLLQSTVIPFIHHTKDALVDQRVKTADRQAELHAGNDAVNSLMNEISRMIWEASDASAKADTDLTDYKRMGSHIESVLMQHMLNASDAQREGFVRGLIAHFFAYAPGRSLSHEYDGIALTARAYAPATATRSKPATKPIDGTSNRIGKAAKTAA